jgi:hypothetical protein
MSLLKAILESDYVKVSKSINKGDDPNVTLNTIPPISMLDLAIDISKEHPSSRANSIITLLKSRGARTYEELLVSKPRNNLPPLSVKGTASGNIKTKGIASLPRRGGTLRRPRFTRKNRK